MVGIPFHKPVSSAGCFVRVCSCHFGIDDKNISGFNAAGVVVHTQMITNPDETIRLEHLPAGVYFFMFEKDGKEKTVKVVKE